MAYNSFPYSNFHELNLDYLLNKSKEIEGNVQETADNVLRATQQADRSTQQAVNSQNSATASAQSAVASSQSAVNSANSAAASAQSATEARAAAGDPKTFTAATQLTDTTKIYVYVGETGTYTYGHYYYYQGGTWHDGGVYGTWATDDALSDSSTNAVQNRVINAAVSELKSDINALLVSGFYLSESQLESSDLVIGENVNTESGVRNTNTKRARTILKPKESVIISFNSDTYQMQVLSYGSNGNLTNGTDYNGKITNTWVKNAIIGFTEITKKYCVIFKRIDEGDVSSTEISAIISCLSLYSYTDKSLSMDGVPADAEAVGAIFKDINGRTRNLVNINGLSNASIQQSNGELIGTASAFSASYLNGLPIETFEENTQYALSYTAYNAGSVTSGNGIRFVVHYTDGTQNLKNTPNNTSEWTKFTYVTAAGKTVDYIGLGYNSGPNNVWHIKEIQIEKGNKATGYVPYNSAIDYVAREKNDNLERNTITYPLSKFYHANDDISLVASYAGVIAKYDELTTLYPDYITKNSITVGDFTNYEYVLTFGNYNAKETMRAKDTTINKPKILICSGVHGYEKSSVMGLYTFVRALCESNFALRGLIGNTIIKIIPVVCPWGYDNDSRLNANGVNINRNFASDDWTLTSQGDNYSGASAGDQLETQVVQNWINANTDAVLMLDWHNSQYTSEISCLLSGNTTQLSELKKKFLFAIENVVAYWQIERGLSNENVYGYTATSSVTGTTKSYAIDKGLIAGTLETSWNIGNTGQDSAETIGTNAEVMGNLLIGLKSYYEI